MSAGTSIENGEHAHLSALDRPVLVTFFKDRFATSKTQQEISLRGLVPRIRDTVGKTKNELPWLKLARFGDERRVKPPKAGEDAPTLGSFRHDANVLSVDGCEADYDGEQITVARARQIITTAGIAAIIYTSPSHTAEKPRWRVLCPTSHSYPPAERARFVARINGLFVGALAKESFVTSQSYFYGHIFTSTSHETVVIDGRAIDLADELDDHAIARPTPERPQATSTPSAAQLGRPSGCTAYGMAVLESEATAIRMAVDGNKHHALNKAAYSVGGLVPAHLIESIAKAGLIDALNSIAGQCKDFNAALHTLDTAFADGMAHQRSTPVRTERYNGHDNRQPVPIPYDEPEHDEDGVIIERAASITPLPLEYFNDIATCVDALDFVQGTLTDQGSSVIYGESNSGKTFWATDLALHIASGITWNGKRVEQGGVIYCVLEGGMGFRNRVSAWRADHDALETPVYFAAIPAAINLLNPDAHTGPLIETILAAASHMGVKVKLVVIDTLARAMAGGAENSSEDMGALVMNMDRIRAETGANVCFIHHSGKDQAKGARGHSSLRAAIDTEIEVIAGEDGATRTATIVKQREMPKGDVHTFSLEVVEIGTNRHGEAVTTCLVRYADDGASDTKPYRRKLPQSQSRALDVLSSLIAASGQPGGVGLPSGVLSVPEKWWRERFYDRAMPGAEHKAKEKAFRRAADALVSCCAVGMSAGRVWIVSYEKDAL